MVGDGGGQGSSGEELEANRTKRIKDNSQQKGKRGA